MLYYTTKGTDKESEYDKLREELNNKINEIKDKIYIPKTSIILLDENNSDILKQKKKINKSDNDNKIIEQEKNETVFYIVQDQVYHLVLIYYLFLTLSISTIPIENVFVSSGLNLPFTKGITGTALGLGWYKGLQKNPVSLEN